MKHLLNFRTIQPQEAVHIRTTLKPGDIGNIIVLHGKIYAQEFGYDGSFEGYVADSLAEFKTCKGYDILLSFSLPLLALSGSLSLSLPLSPSLSHPLSLVFCLPPLSF